MSVATVRSFFVADSFTWTNSTSEPHPPPDRGGGTFIGRIEARGIQLRRGKIRLRREHQRLVMSRWDDDYARDYVDKPQWIVRHDPANVLPPSWRLQGFWGRLGFDHHRSPSGSMVDSRTVTFPIWPIAVLCAIWPAVWLRRTLRQRRRRVQGLCLACGYDLRGNEQGRCPECGMVAV